MVYEDLLNDCLSKGNLSSLDLVSLLLRVGRGLCQRIRDDVHDDAHVPVGQTVWVGGMTTAHAALHPFVGRRRGR